MRRFAIILALCTVAGSGCTVRSQSSDSVRAQAQEDQLREAYAQVPPPAIKNWNELRLLKMVQEMRDQVDLPTWTYTKNMDGKYTFVCESIGFGIPYDTRANNPEHYEFVSTTTGRVNGSGCNFVTQDGKCIMGEYHVMPQAEPNGLFIPHGAHGTWNMCRNPTTGKPTISYQEEDVAVFTYKLPAEMVEGYHGGEIEHNEHTVDNPFVEIEKK